MRRVLIAATAIVAIVTVWAVVASIGPPDGEHGPDRGTAGPVGSSSPSLLEVARFYHVGLGFPTDAELAAARAGERVVLTFKADPGWIVGGGADRELHASATVMSEAGGDWIVGYWHEPEDDLLPEVYRQAFRHVATIFRVPHVRTIAVLMASTFASGDVGRWYPGDDVVDVVGVDGYDWRGCRSNGGVVAAGAAERSFAQIFAAADRFALAHHKPMLVAEFGTPVDPADPQNQTTWLTEAGRWLADHPEVIGAWYFDLGRQQGFRCEWALTPSASAAYRSFSIPPGESPDPTTS